MGDTTSATITIYACPRRHVSEILGELASHHWAHDWQEWPSVSVYDELDLGETWTNGLAGADTVDSWSSFLADLGCRFHVTQDPSGEWDGELAIGAPNFGVWTSEGKSLSVPASAIDELIDSIDDPPGETPDEIEAALDDLIARLAGLTGRLHRRALKQWEESVADLPTLYPIEPEDLECERCGGEVEWAEDEDVLVCQSCAFRMDPPDKMPEEEE